ncbi:MAG: hypothetical protein U1F37_09040 [Alphaproteobacteria bacterium]
MTGTAGAGAQGIRDQTDVPARRIAAPDPDTAAKSAPLARDAERSVAGPDATAPTAAAPGNRLAGDGGIGGAYWRGTPFALVAETLPRLPIRIVSPALRALTLEVLTAPAEARGDWMAARLAALRAERLYAMGQLEAAEAAFRAAGLAKGDPARAPAEVETKLCCAARAPRAPPSPRIWRRGVRSISSAPASPVSRWRASMPRPRPGSAICASAAWT